MLCSLTLKKHLTRFGTKDCFTKCLLTACDGITDNSLNLIKDIYKKTKRAVKVDGVSTECFSFLKGVRQGSPICT